MVQAWEEELRKHKPSYSVGEPIRGVTCPECRIDNERYKPICYSCGASLVTSITQPIELKNPDTEVAKAVGGGYLVFLLLWFGGICFVCWLLSRGFSH